MTEIFIFSGVIFFALLIHSFAGFAAGLIAIPILTLFFEPKVVVPAFSLLILLLGAFLVLETRAHIKWKKVGALLLGGMIGTPIGAYALKYFNPEILRMIIAGLTILFGILLLSGIKLAIKDTRGCQRTIGLISGFFGGSVALSGPPVVIFGISQNWGKNLFRSTLITYSLFLGIVGNLSFFFLRLFNQFNLRLFGFSIIPAMVAFWLGVRFKNRVSEASFRRAILILVIAVGILGLSRIWFK